MSASNKSSYWLKLLYNSKPLRSQRNKHTIAHITTAGSKLAENTKISIRRCPQVVVFWLSIYFVDNFTLQSRLTCHIKYSRYKNRSIFVDYAHLITSDTNIFTKSKYHLHYHLLGDHVKKRKKIVVFRMKKTKKINWH